MQKQNRMTVPHPGPPQGTGLDAWVRLLAAIFIWFAMWGLLDLMVQHITSQPFYLICILSALLVMGIVLIIVTQPSKKSHS